MHYPLERFVNVYIFLRRRFYVTSPYDRHEIIDLLSANCSFSVIPLEQVHFVPHSNQDSFSVEVRFQSVRPLLHFLEATSIRYIVYEYGGVRISVVHGGKGLILFLSCRIPNIELQNETRASEQDEEYDEKAHPEANQLLSESHEVALPSALPPRISSGLPLSPSIPPIPHLDNLRHTPHPVHSTHTIHSHHLGKITCPNCCVHVGCETLGDKATNQRRLSNPGASEEHDLTFADRHPDLRSLKRKKTNSRSRSSPNFLRTDRRIVCSDAKRKSGQTGGETRSHR